MTALDDALNEASATFGPHQLKAYWRESDGASDGSVNADTPTDLTVQSDGNIKVAHSLSDALPDPVSMTGSADASGILTAGLLGREGLVLATSGLRTYDGGTVGAAATVVTSTLGGGTIRDDLLLAGVLINDNTASLAQTNTDPKDAWDFIGKIDDAPVSLYVFAKRRWRTGNPQLTLVSDKPVNFVSVTIPFWARNPAGMAMDYRVTANFVAESSSVTSHSVGHKLSGKGYQVGFWGTNLSTPITSTAPAVTFGAPASGGIVLSSAVTPLSDAGAFTLNATQGSATAVMAMAAVSVEPLQRPRLDARQYFSMYNRDSPVYGWDRDTAQVTAAIRVLTSGGPVDTSIFSGVMQGIPIEGRSATLNAASASRIAMNRSVVLPPITGNRENLTIDWLATYLMARGGSFVGPAPGRYTRYWAPMYGSTHAHWDSIYGYNYGIVTTSAFPLSRFGLRPPTVVNGKWGSAMYAQQSATRMEEIVLNPGDHSHQFPADDAFPHLRSVGGPVMADLFSLANSKGRLQFWIRGDAVTSAPAYLAAADDFIFSGTVVKVMKSGQIAGFVECGIASNTRNPFIRMGDQAGTLSVSFPVGPLPTDGNWYHVGFWYDYAAGTGNAAINAVVSTSSAWSAGGFNVTTELPATDASGRAAGMTSQWLFKSHLPISDLIFDAGESYSAGQWNTYYPTPPSPGANATMRMTNIPLQGVAEPTSVNAWDTLGDLARNALAAYRCDEADAINFLPLSYFGETAQMTPVAVQDTTKNMADPDVDVDPSKARNAITLNFPDTRVDSSIQQVLLYLTSTPIAKGVTDLVFPLDLPTAEIHGQALQSGSTWTINNLTSSQITTPSLPKQNHYITANTASDGSGTVLNATQVGASIIAWDAQSITIRFTNNMGTTVYLANNGDQIPYMQILGYALRATSAYVTVRDTYSVAVRGERSLEADMNWLHTRALAADIAGQMVNQMARPRGEIETLVTGDPRRKPGQMVTINDLEGMQIAGTWRVLSVEHEADDARYTQVLEAIPVNPTGVWDAASWDAVVWGA